MNVKPRVAVVGGGIFGVSAAVALADAGCAVTLFERSSTLLGRASGINQYRLHRGYHYPRSKETAVASLRSEASFSSVYSDALIANPEHYYAIAKDESLTSASEFVSFCQALGLEHDESYPEAVERSEVELCVRVQERLFDPIRLRGICEHRLREAGVDVRLAWTATPNTVRSYDFAVIAVYSRTNQFLRPIGLARDYQFELCEKPVVRVKGPLQGKSVVIMDGPFMCIDPLGSSGLSVLGNVVHAIHHWNVGAEPEIPPGFESLLDGGIIENPSITKFHHFVESGSRFLKDLNNAEHVGSMFTFRTVLPDTDDTDARPTLVEAVDDRLVVLFSGKIGTSVETARETVAIARQTLDLP